MKFLIRVKDRTIGGITRSLDLPSTNEFNYLGRSNYCYTLKLQVVRFAINDDTCETVITNLPQQSFQADELKQPYAMRWRIEISFRELKYPIVLTCFHSKKWNISSRKYMHK